MKAKKSLQPSSSSFIFFSILISPLIYSLLPPPTLSTLNEGKTKGKLNKERKLGEIGGREGIRGGEKRGKNYVRKYIFKAQP